jgi:thiol-disulfide isomerase/thioredoxin
MDCIMSYRATWAWAIVGVLLAGGCEIGTERLPEADAPASDGASWSDGSDEAERGAPHGRVARGNLRFVEGYAPGYARAAEQGKPMLVFFTAPWCHYCHQMADEAFTHPQVVRLAEQFVCILVDADREPRVCRQFQVTGYPTIQFLSPRGVPLERVVGKKPGHQLMMAMQAALQHVARRDAGSDETQLR